MIISPEWLDVLQATLASILIGVTLVALPHAWLVAARWWRSDPSGRRPWRVLLAATAAAAVVRWGIAPLQLATLFIGVARTHEAVDLVPVAHYGVASSALYHVVFAWLPLDHRVMMATNAVLGVLLVPTVATFVGRVLADRRAGAWMGVLVALTPMFVRNDTSDANNVPCLLWLFAGLVLWLDHLERLRWTSLASATVLLVLAAVGRPEMPILVAVAVLATAWVRGGLRQLWTPRLLVAGVIGALAIAPHVIHVLTAASLLSAGNDIPGASWERFADYDTVLFSMNAVLWPTLYPAALTVLAVGALVRPPAAKRRAVAALVALALTALLPYSVDLDRANIARVHVPLALFTTALAAGALARLSRRPRGPALAALATGLILVAAVPSVLRLWAPTNEADEEAWLRALAGRLPDTPYTLVARGTGDRALHDGDASRTHLHFPSYHYAPPAGHADVVNISRWFAAPDWDAPVYFILSHRCYAAFRSHAGPAPDGPDLRHWCRRMRDEHTLEPVFEQDTTNHGDVWIRWWGDAPILRVGLYRVAGPAQASILDGAP